MIEAASICATASTLVGGDRATTHGDNSINFANIAAMWNAIIEAKARSLGACTNLVVRLDAHDVANMLEAFKIARRYSGAFNLDDYVDGAGYAGCAGEIASKMLGSADGSADPSATSQLGPGSASAAASPKAVRRPAARRRSPHRGQP